MKTGPLRVIETSAADYTLTRRHIQNERKPQLQRCENLTRIILVVKTDSDMGMVFGVHGESKAGNKRSDFGRADSCHDVARQASTRKDSCRDGCRDGGRLAWLVSRRLNSLAPSHVNSSTVNHGLMCQNNLPCRSKVAGKS